MASEYDDLERLAGRQVKIPSKPVRKPMQWGALQGQQAPARRWIIDHWLTTGVTLMSGPGGTGKTMIAQTIATALALGKPFLDFVAEPQTVLLWACEDDHDELWRRQVDICRYFGVKLGELDDRLIIEERYGQVNTLFRAEYGHGHTTGLLEELRSQVHDYGAQVTFIDNIGQTFGGNENDRHHVTTFINALSGLGGEKSATVLLGHPAKAVGSEYAGSGAWENAVRMRWLLGKKLPDEKSDADEEDGDDPDVRYISKRKVNYTTMDYRKLQWRDGVFVPEGAAVTPMRQYSHAQRAEMAEDSVLRAVDAFMTRSIRTTDAKNSPDYLPRVMADMQLAGDFSRRELAEALNRLRMNGTLVHGAVGKMANRTAKMGLVRGAQSA